MNGEIIKSTCGLCAVGCGIRVHMDGDRVSAVEGDPDNPLNRGELCAKGRASLDFLYHPRRLKHPLKRKGERGSGQWQKISWDDAQTEIAAELNRIKTETGPEAVAFIHGAAKGLQDSYLSRLANLFGTPNVAWQGHVCFVPRVIASKLTYGAYAIPDYDHPPACIILWGKNISETLHHAAQRIHTALEKGTRLLVIDPRETEWVKKSHGWLQPRPGTDLALALGMIHVIVNEGLFDRDVVEQWSIGFNRLKQHVELYSPEQVSSITWVPAKKIIDLARMYARTTPACIQWGNAIDHGVNSFQTARAICILRAITGNVGIAGGELLPTPLPLYGRRSPELELIEKMPTHIWKKRLGGHRNGLPMIRYVHPQDIIKAVLDSDPYAIRALYIQGANPLLSYPEARRVYAALRKVECLIVADMFMTPTAALADILLPAASYLEFDSIVTPPYSYPATLIQQGVVRIGECRSDYEILAGLAEKMGIAEGFWDTETACLDFVLQPAGLTFDALKKRSIIPGAVSDERHRENGFDTPSKKMELYSSRLKEWGFDPLPTWREPPHTPYSDPKTVDPYALILTSWKSGPYRHSGGRQIRALRHEHPEPLVFIHPETAAARDIQDGDWVIIETVRGSICQRARLTRGIEPRVIGADYAWWFPERDEASLYGWAESNINILLDDHPPYNAEMGTTQLRGVACNIKKA